MTVILSEEAIENIVIVVFCHSSARRPFQGAGMVGMTTNRSLIAALALLLVLCGGCVDRPPLEDHDPMPDVAVQRVWQKGPGGWVYARSLFDLAPSGGLDEITRLPTAVVFRAGSAALDLNGYNIVALQAQRLRQLPDAAVTLFCGWSALEVADSAAGHDLAKQRCAAVQTVYRGLGVRTQGLRHKIIAPATEPAMLEAEEGQRSVAVTALATGRTSYRPPFERRGYQKDLFKGIYIPSGFYDWRFDIQIPGNVAFDLDSTVLDTNARRLLDTVVDWILPARHGLYLTCQEYEGESGAGNKEMVLALKRCRVVRDYVVSRGICSDFLFYYLIRSRESSRPSWERDLNWPHAIVYFSDRSNVVENETCENSRRRRE